MIEHCQNYDPSYQGCRECPGKVVVIQRDGSIEIICRAGAAAARKMIATVDNNLPVYPIPFPAEEPSAKINVTTS